MTTLPHHIALLRTEVDKTLQLQLLRAITDTARHLSPTRCNPTGTGVVARKRPELSWAKWCILVTVESGVGEVGLSNIKPNDRNCGWEGVTEMENAAATYVGQVEQDPQGTLWAVLYYRDHVITREQMRSLRKAKRRVSDLVLSAADNYPKGPLPASAPTPCPPVDLRVPSNGTRRPSIAHFV